MNNKLFNMGNNTYPSLNDIVEVKVFQNKNNKQFNLPVSKRNSSPQIMQDIFGDKNVVGLRFKITDIIFKNNLKGIDPRAQNLSQMKGVGSAVNLSQMKGGRT